MADAPPASGLPPEAEALVLGSINLLRRLGALEIRTGYTDDDAGDPVVWWAASSHPQPGGKLAHECAAGWGPVAALFHLCERLVDGGTCTHCGHPTGVTLDQAAEMEETPLAFVMPDGGALPSVCWYAWDPELGTFRRSCEGVAP